MEIKKIIKNLKNAFVITINFQDVNENIPYCNSKKARSRWG